jgi:hypothetical protein
MDVPKTDIYQFQAQLSHRLALWSGFSLGAAAVMALFGGRTEEVRLRRGMASQFAGWGIVDLAIALLGTSGAEKSAASPGAHSIEAQKKTRADLRTVLWANSGLDVGYVTGGALLARTQGRNRPFWRGAGWAIVVQGGFLLIFDLVHALWLRE